MKHSKLRIILREFCLAIMIVLLCAGLIFSVVKNYREIQMTFKTIRYSIQGYDQGEILLIGSSYMEYWTTSEADLGPLHTINVGVAGTRVHNWKENIDNLVTPFHPKAILFYMGSNDIDGTSYSKSGDEVAQELEEFFDMVHDRLPDIPIYYMSITPVPSRMSVWEDTKRCNELMNQLADERDYMTFIDVTDLVLDENGVPKPELFRSDNTHFNADGYALWASAIRPVMLNDLVEGESK